MKKIALTGSMGSGKSSVSKILSQYGYCVWDADDFSRQVLFIPSVENQIKALFDDSIFLEKGKLDRPLVRKQIFSDPSLKKKFEDILHPAIANHFHGKANALNAIAPTAWIFYEASLILEKNKKSEFDACVVVTVNETVRLERILKNRNLSKEEVQKMMAAQMPDCEKIKQADYIIDNSKNLESLEAEVKKMIQFLHLKWAI